MRLRESAFLVAQNETDVRLNRVVGGNPDVFTAVFTDYNRIEHDFATLKRSREYNADKPLEDIIQMYQ